MRDCRSVPTFLRDAFPWGKVVRLKPDRMRGGRQYRFLCRGGGMPRPPEFYTQKLRGTISCLPLTREVARRQPRRRECPTPRSRGERFLRKAFSPGEGFFSVPAVFTSISAVLTSKAGGRGMPPPLQEKPSPCFQGQRTPPVTLCSMTAPSYEGAKAPARSLHCPGGDFPRVFHTVVAFW